MEEATASSKCSAANSVADHLRRIGENRHHKHQFESLTEQSIKMTHSIRYFSCI